MRNHGLSTLVSGKLLVLQCSLEASLGLRRSQATSDVAVANILLPIAYGVAVSLKIDPLLLMLPMGLACSLPFMLVVSTPPNAIAFQTGFITQRDLLRFGVPLTCLGLLIMPLAWMKKALKIMRYGSCTLIAFRVLNVW